MQESSCQLQCFFFVDAKLKSARVHLLDQAHCLARIICEQRARNDDRLGFIHDARRLDHAEEKARHCIRLLVETCDDFNVSSFLCHQTDAESETQAVQASNCSCARGICARAQTYQAVRVCWVEAQGFARDAQKILFSGS